ncbi:MAG: hypothetical protein ACTHZ5_16000 [Micrococcaceae bacterium]
MSFYDHKLDQFQAALQAGNAERAADHLQHAASEGPGSIEQNLADLAALAEKRAQGKS